MGDKQNTEEDMLRKEFLYFTIDKLEEILNKADKLSERIIADRLVNTFNESIEWVPEEKEDNNETNRRR